MNDKKSQAYAWAAYMWQRYPEEMKRLLKYGTPSDELIILAENKFEFSVRGRKKFRCFPVSLHKSAGQKLLFEAVKNVSEFKKEIPVIAYVTYREIAAQVKLRRADATANVHMVAEAVFYRAAIEFKNEVLFSFDSINAWINAKYGKTLGYQTIRKALELLQSKFHIQVREWGKRGVRHYCTKIALNFTKETCASFLLATDDWIFDGYAAFKAVENRESATRQDVLEARIHCYAEGWLEDQEKEMSLWDQGFRLFKTQDAIISSDAEKVSVENDLEELINDVDINRFLGRLVPALQENGTSDRKGTRQLSESIRSG